MNIRMLVSPVAAVITLLLLVSSSRAGHGVGALPEDDLDRLSRGISGESASVRGYSIQRLLEVLTSSIRISVGQEVQERLAKRFRGEVNRETILLAGLGGVESVLEEIRLIGRRPIREPGVGRFFGTDEWAANLVLARRGDAESIAKLLEFARTQDLHTQVVYIAVDLRYVPQPEVVGYLRHYLDSSERLEQVKPTVKGLLAANYAASSLAKMLDDFPLEYREDYSYSEQEIRACRVWMSNQKEWRFR